MKIALVQENSQAAKNELIYTTLKKVVEPMGHEVYNYGMHSAEDPHSRTYVQNGILAAVLLNSGAADYVITGCGTGQGAMLTCNSFPKVLCGHIAARLFSETKVSPRFSVPVFYRGRYVPEEHSKHIVLTYSSDKNRHAQMIQHLPLEEEAAVPEHRERGN